MPTSSLRKPILLVALATGLLLLVPLAAMQVTGEVSWGVFDFVAAGVLLFGAGAAMVLARRRFGQPVQRWLAIAAIALLFCLVWAELAVGLFR
jgi:peptidoglycan/LPS O-acetylase OafA/YrhL